MADLGFWILLAVLSLWTLVADLDFGLQLLIYHFGHKWPVLDFRL